MSAHTEAVAALRAAGWEATADRIAEDPDSADCDHIAEGLSIAMEDRRSNPGTDFRYVPAAIEAVRLLSGEVSR